MVSGFGTVCSQSMAADGVPGSGASFSPRLSLRCPEVRRLFPAHLLLDPSDPRRQALEAAVNACNVFEYAAAVLPLWLQAKPGARYEFQGMLSVSCGAQWRSLTGKELILPFPAAEVPLLCMSLAVRMWDQSYDSNAMRDLGQVRHLCSFAVQWLQQHCGGCDPPAPEYDPEVFRHLLVMCNARASEISSRNLIGMSAGWSDEVPDHKLWARGVIKRILTCALEWEHATRNQTILTALLGQIGANAVNRLPAEVCAIAACVEFRDLWRLLPDRDPAHLSAVLTYYKRTRKPIPYLVSELTRLLEHEEAASTSPAGRAHVSMDRIPVAVSARVAPPGPYMDAKCPVLVAAEEGLSGTSSAPASAAAAGAGSGTGV